MIPPIRRTTASLVNVRHNRYNRLITINLRGSYGSFA
nr:MAG TPA_asm: hypothetical protein [Caudoviricetes sp.]